MSGRRTRTLAQVMASPFYGGPERQVLGLAKALRAHRVETVFYSFAERGLARDFLGRASEAGFAAHVLENNFPHLWKCRDELADVFARDNVDWVCTNGYKPDIVGWVAARRAGRPVVSIAHGWTSATWRVRLNEWVDKRVMRSMDRVVGVSEEQSRRVRRCGASPDRVVTIHNGVDPAEMGSRNDADRRRLETFFETPPSLILVAAGRLSPEKGFSRLIDAVNAANQRLGKPPGLVIFGSGPLEDALQTQIDVQGLHRSVVLGGFRDDLDRLLPQADGFALSSLTEGLPVILLEAMAAGVPPLATPVGGVPEVVRDGVDGWLLTGNVETDWVGCLVDWAGVDGAGDLENRKRRGESAKCRIAKSFTHEIQACRFVDMLESVASG